MKRPVTLLAIGLAAALAGPATPAHAELQTFRLDKAHTRIGFDIRHVFTRVSGNFDDFSGTILLDEKNLAASSVSVTIQAASIDTRNERRDKDLRSADFFGVDSFPTLAFKSTRITPEGANRYEVEGDLTMHGVTKPVTLNAEFLGAGPFGIGGRAMGRKAGFSATATIDRKDFGITWNRTLDQGGTLLGDDVHIVLEVEANLVAPDPGAAATPPAGTR